MPNEEIRASPTKALKDELLQKINKIENEISTTEAQISKLEKKQVDLEAATKRPDKTGADNAENTSDSKQLSVAQLVYSENRVSKVLVNYFFEYYE